MEGIIIKKKKHLCVILFPNLWNNRMSMEGFIQENKALALQYRFNQFCISVGKNVLLTCVPICTLGWKVGDFRWSKAKSLSSGSCSNAANKKENVHPVLHLVRPVILLLLWDMQHIKPFTIQILLCLQSQVCECAGVLWAVAGCIQVRDRPLLDPVCVWVGWDPSSLFGPPCATLQPQTLPERLPSCWRGGLSAYAHYPCR